MGALALLRAGGGHSFPRQFPRQAGLLAFLAFLPAASSAVVQLYHPQDVVSLGLALAGLAQTLRHRWILAGLLFGGALLSKQFAVLLLLPALAAAPDARSRIRLGGTATLVFAAGILPFLAVAPGATLDNLSGLGAGGAVPGMTVLTLAGVTGGDASCWSTWWPDAHPTARLPGLRPRPSSSRSGRPATRSLPSAPSSWL